jgi:DNA polymerase-3 subunit delta
MMHAASVDIYPVYAVVGHDRFLRNEALGSILQGLTDAPDGSGAARFDGSQADLADVLDEVRTPSLLADRRVAIVDDADTFISAHRAALERYVSKPADGGSLVLLCRSLPKNTRLYKIINGNGKVVDCPVPKGRSVIDWLGQRARAKYAKRLDRAAAQLLRDHLGDGLGGLDAELAKLSAYVGEREQITRGDIDALTGHHREERVFAVTDAMASHDAAAALAHWEQVLATDRAAPGRAVAGLAWGVRRLLEARRDWDAGVSVRELARRMYSDPGVLQRRLERVTARQLEVQQRDLLAADLAVKTGASTVGLAVEKFIVKHSAGNPDTN